MEREEVGEGPKGEDPTGLELQRRPEMRALGGSEVGAGVEAGDSGMERGPRGCSCACVLVWGLGFGERGVRVREGAGRWQARPPAGLRLRSGPCRAGPRAWGKAQARPAPPGHASLGPLVAGQARLGPGRRARAAWPYIAEGHSPQGVFVLLSCSSPGPQVEFSIWSTARRQGQPRLSNNSSRC